MPLTLGFPSSSSKPRPPTRGFLLGQVQREIGRRLTLGRHAAKFKIHILTTVPAVRFPGVGYVSVGTHACRAFRSGLRTRRNPDADSRCRPDRRPCIRHLRLARSASAWRRGDPAGGYLADVGRVTKSGGLGLIFLGHPPKFFGHVAAARRHPRVAGAHPRQFN